MQEGCKGRVAAPLHSSTRAADLAAWAFQAVRALLACGSDSKSAAAHLAGALQMLLRVGKRTLGALKGFLPFIPSPQPSPTKERIRARRHSTMVRGLSAQAAASSLYPPNRLVMHFACKSSNAVTQSAGLCGAVVCFRQPPLSWPPVMCSVETVPQH